MRAVASTLFWGFAGLVLLAVLLGMCSDGGDGPASKRRAALSEAKERCRAILERQPDINTLGVPDVHAQDDKEIYMTFELWPKTTPGKNRAACITSADGKRLVWVTARNRDRD